MRAGKVDGGPCWVRREPAAAGSRRSGQEADLPRMRMTFVPHFGHVPGPSCTTSGCIGQVYFTCLGAGAAGSSAMPHFGQAAGTALSTPGHIGQTYLAPDGTAGCADAGAGAG